ncbi:uncharacterized protein MELLADRAFT_106561 [Melampsora larici-populina 98AG31]|uniref:Uncharacterized protein n=1 Tax=Melampsora larici-populina (strain 98AG31 / pathotype 3-4-7) TaxID=747676 RepID=F4RLX0_MELLP|nr:uncharacterized protein MELLADRAFT_106561 [Melampsora larici-populina 98AG31]EGG06616.1 hypothetical protein MELLADRAFT_106561 [Melampsora larici-populina 98AG31]
MNKSNFNATGTTMIHLKLSDDQGHCYEAHKTNPKESGFYPCLNLPVYYEAKYQKSQPLKSYQPSFNQEVEPNFIFIGRARDWSIQIRSPLSQLQRSLSTFGPINLIPI